LRFSEEEKNANLQVDYLRTEAYSLITGKPEVISMTTFNQDMGSERDDSMYKALIMNQTDQESNVDSFIEALKIDESKMDKLKKYNNT